MADQWQVVKTEKASPWEVVGVKQVSPNAPPPKPSLLESLGKFGRGFNETFFPSTNPSDYIEGPSFAVQHPIESAKLLGGAMLEAQGEQLNKAVERAKQGRYGEAVAHGMAYAMPVVGPMAARAGETIGSGEVAEGLGQTAGIFGGMAAPEAARAAKNLPFKKTAQSALGAGERVVAKAQAAAEEANAKSVAKYQEDYNAYGKEVAETRAANAEKLANWEQDVRNVYGENQDAVTTTRRLMAESESVAREIEKANEVRRALHEEQVRAIESGNEQQKAAVAQRIQLLNENTLEGERIANDVRDLGEKVRAIGNQKFETVAQATEGMQANPEPIRAAVQHAENGILKGSPENIKIFRNLLEATDAPAGEATSVGKATPGTPFYDQLVAEGAISPPTPLGFRDLQGFYSELGQKASGGNLPGDIYHALKYVKEQGIGAEMSRMAGEAGVTEALGDARAHWRAYQQTFHDMRAIPKGGSPIARVYRSVDPPTTLKQFTGDAGARAVAQLAAYDKALAKRAASTVSKTRHLETLPEKEKLAEPPKGPKYEEIPSPKILKPKLRDIPEPPAYGELPSPPSIPERQVVNPVEVRRQAIQRQLDKALQSHIFRDARLLGTVWLGIHHPLYALGVLLMPRIESAILNHPSLINWLAQSPAPPPRPRAVRLAPLPLGLKKREAEPPPRP